MQNAIRQQMFIETSITFYNITSKQTWLEVSVVLIVKCFGVFATSLFAPFNAWLHSQNIKPMVSST